MQPTDLVRNGTSQGSPHSVINKIQQLQQKIRQVPGNSGAVGTGQTQDAVQQANSEDTVILSQSAQVQSGGIHTAKMENRQDMNATVRPAIVDVLAEQRSVIAAELDAIMAAETAIQTRNLLLSQSSTEMRSTVLFAPQRVLSLLN